MSVKTALKVLVVICAFGLSFYTPGCADAPETTPAIQYPHAPDIPFVHMDGTSTALSDYAVNSVLMVNFWGLRCQNCIEEMPFLEELHGVYGGKGLVILGVNTDGIHGDLLKKLLPQLPLTVSYPLIVDPDFTIADGYQMTAAPLTVLIARDSTVRYRHEGYDPSDEHHYREIIERLLAE